MNKKRHDPRPVRKTNDQTRVDYLLADVDLDCFMTISLIKRLENHARLRPTEWISGQTYEDLARSLGYKASNVGRRLRELETAGILENHYVRGHVEYKWRGEETRVPIFPPYKPADLPSVAGTARLFG